MSEQQTGERMPKVSVCCSVLNQSQWLREMIATVVAQSFTDWELIVVDDGSTEDIRAVLDAFADERIRYHRFYENQGIPHGINYAFEQARGEYVQPLAADERLHPEKLAHQVKVLDERRDLAAVWGLPREGEMGSRPEWEQYAMKAHNRGRLQWLLCLLNLDQVPLGGCSALWRRSLFDTLGYFDTSLTMFSDHEWYCRLVKAHDILVEPYRWAISLPNPNAVSVGNTEEKVQESMRQLQYVRQRHPVEQEDIATKVTIGIPVKDMAGYVTQAMQSVLDQTHQDFEILVVDDGSTDDTVEVVRKFIADKGEHERIRLHVFPKNNGDRVACNYMIEHAQGDFYVSLSADDLIAPTYLERCVEIFHKNPQIDFVASQTDFIQADGAPYTEPHVFKDIEKAANKTRDEWLARLWHGNVYFGAGMIRTRALRQIGGWKQEYGCLADYEMYLALLQRAQIYVIEEALTHTRIHDKNMSGNIDARWLADTYARIKARYYQPRRKLIIATPFYNAQGFSPYINSLVETVRMLGQLGVDFEYWLPTGDAYIQRVKNTILNKFLEREDATDLLMIDSDMDWPAHVVAQMLLCPEEIIVGSYPQKNSWDKWTSSPEFRRHENGTAYAMERHLPTGGTLIEGGNLAGGFMLFKKAPLLKYREHFKDDFYYDDSADPEAPDRKYTEFFKAGGMQPVGDTRKRFWGEDRSFSLRLKELGIRWWIFTDITFGHWGINRWGGNFKQHLDTMKTPAPVAANEAGASAPLAGAA
jgi:glycosyltransferase involved in cell wall biosynthesis